jgi:hypothetical protein
MNVLVQINACIEVRRHMNENLLDELFSKNSDMKDIDFTLKLDFRKCSIKELDDIMTILYKSSTICHEDIVELADETIYRINLIEYDILSPVYKHFNVFVHKMYNSLKKLNINDKSNIIKEKYNFYLKKPIPNLPSPETPKTNETPPRIMKCIKKRFS